MRRENASTYTIHVHKLFYAFTCRFFTSINLHAGWFCRATHMHVLCKLLGLFSPSMALYSQSITIHIHQPRTLQPMRDKLSIF